MIDINLHSQLFRVYYYCTDLAHILALFTLAVGVIIRYYNACCFFACDYKQ